MVSDQKKQPVAYLWAYYFLVAFLSKVYWKLNIHEKIYNLLFVGVSMYNKKLLGCCFRVFYIVCNLLYYIVTYFNVMKSDGNHLPRFSFQQVDRCGESVPYSACTRYKYGWKYLCSIYSEQRLLFNRFCLVLKKKKKKKNGRGPG
eukprot:TRINITY_DN22907_c0_g1_i1.p2 TRINITY_DN22907_c0_g1~~TRINITY_DN22907_c0_g1_i1.p2  ORF type:complete len:145 (+),score=6.77 TRINITY_DN22907_c0_g1_i1:414-848(+)